MIVLDTNVVSELMRDRPDSGVIKWVDSRTSADLFVTAVAEAEIRVGIVTMPIGRRRGELEAAAARVLERFFEGRVLALDWQAAHQYAAVVSERNVAGRPIAAFDGLIAAIARARGAAIATRGVSGFEGLGIEIVNPWEGADALPR